MQSFDFTALPWQKECLEQTGVLQGESLLLVAPTSAGKSYIAEQLVVQNAIRGLTTLLVVPYVSIAESFTIKLQKLLSEHDKKAVAACSGKRVYAFGDHVGVVVATIESAYMLLTSRECGFHALVLDECQTLTDPSRGTWVESICGYFRLYNKQLLLMSATFPCDCDHILSWLGLRVFQLPDTARPIPLRYGAVRSWKGGELERAWDPVQCALRETWTDVDICETALHQGKNVLYFGFKRLDVENQARRLQERFGQDIVSYHHAGRPLQERQATEEAFVNKTVRILTCTTTLAAGVNLPAAYVIISSSLLSTLSLEAFRQIAGRAGRLGMDDTGYCICICDSVSVVKRWNRFFGTPYTTLDKTQIRGEKMSKWFLWGLQCGLFDSLESAHDAYSSCLLGMDKEKETDEDDDDDDDVLETTCQELARSGWCLYEPISGTISLTSMGEAVASIPRPFQSTAQMVQDLHVFATNPVYLTSRLQVLFLLAYDESETATFYPSPTQEVSRIVQSIKNRGGPDASVLQIMGCEALLSRRFVPRWKKWLRAFQLSMDNSEPYHTQQSLWNAKTMMVMCDALGYSEVGGLLKVAHDQIRGSSGTNDENLAAQLAGDIPELSRQDMYVLLGLGCESLGDCAAVSLDVLRKACGGHIERALRIHRTIIHRLSSEFVVPGPPHDMLVHLYSGCVGLVCVRPLHNIKETEEECMVSVVSSSAIRSEVLSVDAFAQQCDPENTVIYTVGLKQCLKNARFRNALESFRVMDVGLMSWLHRGEEERVLYNDGNAAANSMATRCFMHSEVYREHLHSPLALREHKLLSILTGIELRGMVLHVDKVRVQMKEWYDECILLQNSQIPEACDPMSNESVCETLGLPLGSSTESKALVQTCPDNAVARAISKYRSLRKQYNMVRGVLEHVDSDGRVRCEFVQISDTGRIHTKHPNIIGVPSAIQTCFGAQPGHVLMRADFKHMELRLMTWLAKCSRLLHLFSRLDCDPFQELADHLKLTRSVVKELVYGVCYGSSLDKEDPEVRRIIMLFCGTDIKKWKETVIKDTRDSGSVVTTLDGFQRRLPDLVSSDVQIRRKAERQVVNTLVQGTAADLLKRCILGIHNKLDPTHGSIVMIRHDEIVLEVCELYRNDVRDMVEDIMKHCCPEYQIPLSVDIL